MAISNIGQWQQTQTLSQRSFTCGHSSCGRDVASIVGWYYNNSSVGRAEGYIYICPMCHRPSFFDATDNLQMPGISFGRNIESLPDDVGEVYEEIRKATGVGSYTAVVLACRKLLMHIAVEKGATTNLGFIDYVEYIVDNHYTPPGSKPWVDKIRTVGNEANHEIRIMKREQAEELVNFLEMLLKFIYEFPAKIAVPQAS